MKKSAYYHLKSYKKELILGPLFKILEVIFELAMPFFMAHIINVGIPLAINNGDYSHIYTPGLIIIGLCIFGYCSTLVCQYFASVAMQGYGTKLRNTIYKKVLGFSQSDLDKIGKGNLNSIISNDVNRLQLSVAMMIRLVIRAPSIVLGSLICVFIINWKIAFIFLVVVVLIGLILFLIIKFSSKRILKAQESTDNIVQISSDGLHGTRIVRALNNEEKEAKKFEKATEEYYKDMKKVSFLSALTNPLTALVINTAIVLVIYFSSSIILKDNSSFSVGELTSLISYLNQILVALVVVSNLIVIFTKAFASKKRVEKVLNLEENIKNNGVLEVFSSNLGEEIIKFGHVSYANSLNNKEVLSDLNFSVSKGETIGIIGGTGSGKTTIINLLERFIEPTSGQIIYKNNDIKDYKIESLRSDLGLVSQKTTIFKGTIKSNIKIANENLTDEEIINALKEACAYEFIEKYDDNINHEAMEGGSNFSGGQKQRISIARTLAKNSEVLILDDSLSALDYLTEKVLRTNLSKHKELTKIIVSQRVSSLVNADKIIVLDDGKIVGYGKHDDLLNNCEVYKEIYESQVRS